MKKPKTDKNEKDSPSFLGIKFAPLRIPIGKQFTEKNYFSIYQLARNSSSLIKE